MQRSPRLLDLLVFVVGVGTLGSEIAAARLLAPWFGSSTIVWANTIAIVLVALAVGYSLGGRLADRRPEPSTLAAIVLVASALLAVVPFISGPFLRQAVKAVDQLSAATFLGSLVGVGVLLAIPLVLLGMVSPFAVRLSVVDVEDAGRVAGRLSAIATVGSLTGTFLAALLLIPVAGTRRTFLIFAAAMALAAVLNLRERQLVALVVPAVIAGLMVIPTGVVKEASAGDRLIWERQTEYQYARVLEDPDGRRVLELNEGHAVHSVYRPGEYLTGNYWDELLALTQAVEGRTGSVAILGNAAGTTARQLGHFYPDTAIEAVEIDPDVTEVGRELFDMRAPKLRTYAADARPWLQGRTDRFDAILVDAYRQPYIPFYLATAEFFTEVRERLNPGGVLVINVGHPENSPTLEKVLSATVASAFGRDRVFRDPAQPTNTQLLAVNGPADPAAELRSEATTAPADLAAVLRSTADRLAPALRGGTVYTDDRAPVEWLVDASLADQAQ